MVRKRDLQMENDSLKRKLKAEEEQRYSLDRLIKELRDKIVSLRTQVWELEEAEPEAGYVVVTVADNGTKRVHGVYSDRNKAATAKKRLEREHEETGKGALEVSAHKVMAD